MKEVSYWSVANGSDTMIDLWNPNSSPEDYVVTLYYSDGSGQYHIPVYLDANASLDISLKELILSHHPDPQGSVIPESVEHGSATFANIDGETLPMDLVASVGVFNVKTATCTPYCVYCDGYTGVAMSPTSFNLSPAGTVQLKVAGAFHNEHTGIITQNAPLSPDSWSSSNANVATVSGSGLVTAVAGGTVTIVANNVDYTPDGGKLTSCDAMCPTDVLFSPQATGTVKPVITSIDPDLEMIGSSSVQLTINGSGFGSSPTVNLPTGITKSSQGSTTGRIVIVVNIGFNATIGSTGNNITVTANGQTSSPAAFTVNGPAKMIVQADTIGTTSNNPSAQSRFVTYQVQNFNNTAATNIPIAESISFGTFSCSQPDPGHSTAQCNAMFSTDGTGFFTDEWGMYTQYTPAGCGVTITDHWQWCGPTGSAPPAPNPGKTFGTLTGYIHTADTSINTYINPPTKIPTGTTFVP